MKTIEVEIKLMEHFFKSSLLMVPNVTEMSGIVNFENDMLILSRSDYATGIEIKVTKADLKNDLKKLHIVNISKHQAYLKSWYQNLKYFYYCVPEELVEDALKQIPRQFGLLSINKYKNNINSNEKIYYVHTVRTSKVIDNKKWDIEMMFKLARLGAIRILKYKKLQLKYQKREDKLVLKQLNPIKNF